jgi:hypothetical protein
LYYCSVGAHGKDRSKINLCWAFSGAARNVYSMYCIEHDTAQQLE